MQVNNKLLEVVRLPEHLAYFPEIKDPCVVKAAEDRYLMYASIGDSRTQKWIVGIFEAEALDGIWQEIAPVKFVNLSGAQLCAPAVTHTRKDGKDLYEMYIQSACFEEDCKILYATSQDGQTFTGHPLPLVTKEDLDVGDNPVVGVYDVAVSEIKHAEQEISYMLYSGYRKIGCGDIYLSYRDNKDPNSTWSRGKKLIAQEDLPFHNRPDYEFFEWGLEGAKLLQLADDLFVIIGVCFLPKPHGFQGTRQRVFMAASQSLDQPFQGIGLPFEPKMAGENGHPDTFIDGDMLHVIYQERDGDGKPWYLRYAKMHIPALTAYMLGKLTITQSQFADLQEHQEEKYYFRPVVAA